MSKVDETPNIFNSLVFLMDENIRGVQAGVYSVAFLGLAVALRSVRPFARFSKPSDIPNGFIKSRMKLNGTVQRIEPNGALLMVQHKPLIKLLPAKKESLPVKVAGVSVSGNGISWLQSIVAGNQITFIPVLKEKEYVLGEVSLQQVTKKNKLRVINIGPALVSTGFAEITEIEKPLLKDVHYLSYYKQLKTAELNADRKRQGVWYYVKTTQNVSQKLLNYVLSLFKRKSKLPNVAAAH